VKHTGRFVSLVAAILACLVFWNLAAPAGASCDAGAVPVALDIRDIRIYRFNLVGARTPGFELKLRRVREYEHGRLTGFKPTATLHVLKTMALPRGSYVLDGDAGPLFERVASELTAANVFEMRLSPIDGMYLDGPSDEISVLHCAARVSVMMVPKPFEWVNRSDENGKRFFGLLDRIGDLVVAQHGIPIPTPEATP